MPAEIKNAEPPMKKMKKRVSGTSKHKGKGTLPQVPSIPHLRSDLIVHVSYFSSLLTEIRIDGCSVESEISIHARPTRKIYRLPCHI